MSGLGDDLNSDYEPGVTFGVGFDLLELKLWQAGFWLAVCGITYDDEFEHRALLKIAHNGGWIVEVAFIRLVSNRPIAQGEEAA